MTPRKQSRVKKKQSPEKNGVLRQVAEIKYANELDFLESIDDNIKPAGWRLSPQMLKKFIVGSKKGEFDIPIEKKFYGNEKLIERAIVTLASDRGLLLIGRPGTGKSWLSELLAAGICRNSTLVVQGTAATTEDQIKYSWNIASVIANGQSRETLIPSPVMVAMEKGQLARFEELTRCTSDVQDSLISILSEKYVSIPELDKDNIVFAKQGFNIIATANSRDKGVNELSSALKRRFNFVTIPIVTNSKTEREIINFRIHDLLKKKGFDISAPKSIISIMLETFKQLRLLNDSIDNDTEKLESSLSTAEQIGIIEEAMLQSNFFEEVDDYSALAYSFVGSLVRNLPEDLNVLNKFWNSVIVQKQEKSETWKKFYEEGIIALKSIRGE